MKKTIQLLVLLIITLNVFSQKQISIGKSCSYYGEKMPTQAYTFSSDNEAEAALKLITDASGLSPNFTIVAGNVPNACATMIYNAKTKELERYIVYNQTFMYNISNRINYWASVSILAHEVGHHLNGHSLQLGGSRPSLELEADKFSGFILAKLGATLEETQSAINSLVSEQGSTTHPPKSARLAAIANGWYSSSNMKNPQNKPLVNASRPRAIFMDNVLGDKSMEEVFYEKNSINSFKIISEKGYVFSEKEFKVIKITDDLLVYWFPDYKAYGYLDRYTEIKMGQREILRYGSATYYAKNYGNEDEYIHTPGNYLIIYYPNGGFIIIANGKIIDQPQEIKNKSYWQTYPESVKNSTGVEDDYYFVYKINDGIKDVLILVSNNEIKETKINNKISISSGDRYSGGPIIF